jgi:hypothetical protein
MFSKFERSAASGERGNAAVVALCVTTLAVGVVMAIRLLSGSSSSKPTAPIAATNIGAGESDADPSGARRASSGPITADASGGASTSGSVSASGASASEASAPGGAVGGSSPVPTLPGSVPTIPPEGAVPVAAPVPVVAVTPTTAPPVILGLKTPQSASRNLFDAWKENDRARALRFASAAAVDAVFRTPWGAEVQDDGCSETSNPTSFHCAFVGDEIAWIIVVDQRIGPTGREFVPTRTMKTEVKGNTSRLASPDSSLTYAPPTPDAVVPSGTPSSPGPTTTIDPLAGDDPLVDPAGTPDLTDPAIIDPSLLDPAGAAAALAESIADTASVGSGAKPSASPSSEVGGFIFQICRFDGCGGGGFGSGWFRVRWFGYDQTCQEDANRATCCSTIWSVRPCGPIGWCREGRGSPSEPSRGLTPTLAARGQGLGARARDKGRRIGNFA